MIRLFSSVVGNPIICIDNGFTDYKLTAFVVDTDRLAIELAVVQQPFNPKRYYIMPRSIREVGSQSIIINSDEDISEAEDLVRYQAIIDAKPFLIGYRVVSSSNQKLGFVKDLGFDSIHLTISKLVVRSHWTRRILTKDLLINRSQIIKIENKTVIVKETKTKARKTSAKLLPVSS